MAVRKSAVPAPSDSHDEESLAEGADGSEEETADDPVEVDGELAVDAPAALPLDDDHDPLDGDGEAIPAPPASSTAIERFDPFAAYLREIQRHPLLSAEETQALAVRFSESQDAAAAARLVTSNLRLVVKIAYEYRRAYRNMMDLVQEGNIGLMQAVKRYDPYRGVKLSSYAAWWIRAYILRFILNNWRLVKLGTTQVQRKLFFNLRKARAELESMGIDPTTAELAKRLDVAEQEVAEMDVRMSASEKSLDAPVGDADGRATTRGDLLASPRESPETLLGDEEVGLMLREKLAVFRETLIGKEKELAIFDERLISEEPLTLQELGDRYGISRERVRQLEQRLTTRLREFLQSELGEATLIDARTA